MKKTVVLHLDPAKEAIKLAVGYLYTDWCNPDVGMGMATWTAVSEAIEELRRKYGDQFVKGLDEDKLEADVIASWNREYGRYKRL